MCYLKPLKVNKVIGKTVFLNNGIKAYYDKNVGQIKPNDKVLVYGNLIIQKIENTCLFILSLLTFFFFPCVFLFYHGFFQKR